MVGLNLNEQNRVFSTIRTEKKQLCEPTTFVANESSKLTRDALLLPQTPSPTEPDLPRSGKESGQTSVPFESFVITSESAVSSLAFDLRRRRADDPTPISQPADIFKNLFLSSKDLDKLMQSFAFDDEEVAQGSGSPQEFKSFPVRPSPKKDVVLSSPRIAISPSRMASKRDADDADDEEDDGYFDLDEIEGRSDHEGTAGVAKFEEVEPVAMDEDGFEVDWYSGDGLKVKVDL